MVDSAQARRSVLRHCNYGRGRGSSLWKDCEYVFLLGDWHLRTSTAIAKILSFARCTIQIYVNKIKKFGHYCWDLTELSFVIKVILGSFLISQY